MGADGTRAGWAIGLGLAALVIAASDASPARGQTVGLESFAGSYRFAGGQTERDRLQAAIDSVVDRMNVFVREIARGEIRRNVRPEPRIVVGVPDDRRVRLTLGSWGPLDVPLGGRRVRVRGPDGSDTRLSARFRDGRIETHQASDRGTRENWLSLSDDRGWLFLQVRISADALPAAIRYTLSYRRER